MEFCMVEFHDTQTGRSSDLQLPMNLSGNDLVVALATAYKLPINVNNPEELYLRTEDPISLIEGDATLEQLGLSNGTRIYFDPR